MTASSRLPAVLAYLVPVIGWLYVFLFERKNPLAIFHLRQAIGLFLFLAGTLVVWVVLAWVLAWIPLMAALSAGLFGIVMAAYLYGAVIWLMGLSRAASNRQEPLPIFGAWANRLPIR